MLQEPWNKCSKNNEMEKPVSEEQRNICSKDDGMEKPVSCKLPTITTQASIMNKC